MGKRHEKKSPIMLQDHFNHNQDVYYVYNTLINFTAHETKNISITNFQVSVKVFGLLSWCVEVTKKSR